MLRALSAGAAVLLLLAGSRAAGQFQAVGEQWQAHYSGPGNYHDELSDMTADPAGNVYIAGYNYGKDADRDFITIKYDTQGYQLWTQRYDGPGHNRDVPQAIAVDQAGCVYVTGYSYGSAANYDFATIKYDPLGNELWVARYNGLVNSHEYAAAVAVDHQGGVYVTGYCQIPAAGTDCLTVKYDHDGNEQWVRRYNGPANGYDSGLALGLDSAGNIIVTGYSDDIFSGRDYLTIKYDTNGTELWTARYTGPSQGYDEARALVVDENDCIYLTGRSYGSGSSSDAATIKYDPAGNELWAARYSGPALAGDQGQALALDNWGNIYIAGVSNGGGSDYDYVTIKYNADNGKYDTNGKAQWLAWYDGPANSTDRTGAIALDGAQNIYLSGTSAGLVTQEDIATIKYNPQGQELWTARYNAEGISDDELQALVIDQQGQAHVAGYVRNGINYDYATIKYDSQGRQQWVRLYGREQSNEQAQALAVDPAGNICVTGNRGSHCLTVKYDPAGNELWAAEYDGASSSSDYACDLAIDTKSNILVAGYSYQSGGGGNDYTVIKYDPNGYELWAAGYDGPGHSSDRAYNVKTDHQDNVFVTGYSYGSGTGYDYAIVKYDPNGCKLWSARYNGAGNSSDYAQALTVDRQGNAYVTGYVYNIGTGRDYATIKYDPNGCELWVACYDGPAHGSDYAQALAVDQKGHVYVTGYSYGSGTGYDFATIKYDPQGHEIWTKRYNDPINNGDYARSLALDAEGQVYVTGYSYADGNADFVTIKYAPDAGEVWIARYDGPADSYDDIPKALALDNRGNVYVAGVSGKDQTDQDFVTIKYSQLQPLEIGRPRQIEIEKLKVKAAPRDPQQQGPWNDNFELSGAFDLLEQELNLADHIYLTLWNDHEIIFQQLLPFEPEKFQNGKYQTKGPPGGITLFKFNLDKIKPHFTIKAGKVDLTGLNSPVVLELEIGPYYAIGIAGEQTEDYLQMGMVAEDFKDVINGRNPMPMKLLLGYADALRVDKAAVKHHRRTGYDSLYLRGALAVRDRAVDLTRHQVTLRWGADDFTETIEKGAFVPIKGKYVYKRPKDPTGLYQDKKIKLAIFDLQKCIFVISVNKTTIQSKTGSVPLKIAFGPFEQLFYCTLDNTP